MTPRTTVWAAALLMAAPLVVVAHEGHEHKVMGTVAAVHADTNRVEIKTPKGDTVAFAVDASTKYLKGTASVTLAALTPGTRVVAEGKMTNDVVMAATVRIGVAAESPAPKPAPVAH
jgi:hypothetical protein